MPSRLLLGILPEALLGEYDLWQDEATEPCALGPGEGKPGFRRLRGYPKSAKGEDMILVEFQSIGSWEEFLASSAAALASAEDEARSGGSGAFLRARLEATGMPGRTLRVVRRKKAIAEHDFRQRKAVAAELERLGLVDLKGNKAGGAAASAKRAAARKKDAGPEYAVGDMVEFDTDGQLALEEGRVPLVRRVGRSSNLERFKPC